MEGPGMEGKREKWREGRAVEEVKEEKWPEGQWRWWCGEIEAK